MQNKKLTELIEAGRFVATGKYYDGTCDEIKYVDRNTGKDATIKQIKLNVGLTTARGRKIVTAVMRVKEGDDPKAILANLNLHEGETIVMDVDSLSKLPPSAKGAEPTWMLRIFAAFPAKGEPDVAPVSGESDVEPASGESVVESASGESDVAA